MLGKYHGYRRWKRWIYACNAVLSSAVGLSGNRAKVVWNSFQAARPSSILSRVSVSIPLSRAYDSRDASYAYFAVSLPSFGAMACPVSMAGGTSTCPSEKRVFPEPCASGCRTPWAWLRKEATKAKQMKDETPIRSRTNLRLGPGATGMVRLAGYTQTKS